MPISGSVRQSGGTAFPSSPVTNERFFRTDRGLEYFYDGTRWVTVHEYHIPMGGSNATLSASTNVFGAAQLWNGEDIYITNLYAKINVAATNNATNYWDMVWQKIESGAVSAATLTTVSTSADSAGWIEKTTAINAAHTDLAAIRVNLTKVLGPGNFQGYLAMGCRRIG